MRLATLAVLAAVFLVDFTKSQRNDDSATRLARETNAEEMVNNILQWLHSVYKQNNRKARQGALNRDYLPPNNNNQKPERPRPFQPPSSTATPYQPYNPDYQDSSSSGYPQPGPSPQPPFPDPDYSQGPSTSKPYKPSGTTGISSSVDGESGYDTDDDESSTATPYRPGKPTNRPDNDNQTPDQGSYRPGKPTNRPDNDNQTPDQGSYRPGKPTGKPDFNLPPDQGTYRPIPSNPPPTPKPNYRPPEPQPDDDDRHPPHIHAIDVDCAKDMMTINIEFNKEYNGLIYSKGFYNNPDCVYVKENSGEVKYSFTVNLNSCGTEFINGFDTQGQSYLENILVLQNEAGIQEVWDSIRSVRCLWEGNINKQLSIALSVGMLNQEIVNFSGDTAMASLDIQLGRGPFAPQANGLVKIGERMTLVISVTGDPGFDIQVKECVARDSDSRNNVAITDENGCILKPKLFGAFQKTKETGNTGASIIAFAFFNAFKFPDEMDLILECNVELCKVNCEVCPDPTQSIEPRRRRRDLYLQGNETLHDPIKVGRGIRVIVPEDLAEAQQAPIGLCVSYAGFVWGGAFMLLVVTASCLSAACMYLRLQKHTHSNKC